jgi:ATP-dependent DNA helicase RecQ
MKLASETTAGKKRAPKKVKSQGKKSKDAAANSGTVYETLTLLKDGKGAEEIAVLRSLTVGTIESHLTKAIEAKMLNIKECMEAELVDTLGEIVKKAGESTLSEIFNANEGKYSYSQIRMVQASLKAEK